MLKITIGDEGTIYLAGRLDAAQVDKAKKILSGLETSIRADCSDLEYISSAGIGLLMVTYKRIQDAGHSFRLVNVPPRIRTVFQYAGLDKLLLADP